MNLTVTSRSLEILPKIVSEYDQEIPQSQTTDNPVAPRGRAVQPSSYESMHLHTKFEIPISKNIGDMHQTQCGF